MPEVFDEVTASEVVAISLATAQGTKISDAAAVAMAESGKGVSLLVSEGRR